jgi:hypothetical protein
MTHYVKTRERAIRNIENVFEMWFVVGETFEDSAEGDSDIEDRDELELVFREAYVGSDIGKPMVYNPNHLNYVMMEGI